LRWNLEGFTALDGTQSSPAIVKGGQGSARNAMVLSAPATWPVWSQLALRSSRATRKEAERQKDPKVAPLRLGNGAGIGSRYQRAQEAQDFFGQLRGQQTPFLSSFLGLHSHLVDPI